VFSVFFVANQLLFLGFNLKRAVEREISRSCGRRRWKRRHPEGEKRNLLPSQDGSATLRIAKAAVINTGSIPSFGSGLNEIVSNLYLLP
jgi:hypothetical protein